MDIVLYQATNVLNGKRYIGITGQGLDTRRRGHINAAKAKRRGCVKFNAAIRKYGEENFEWRILASFSDRAAALRAEVEIIKSQKPEYNITYGGAGVIMPRSPEWIEKIKAALVGRVIPAEQLEKMKNYVHKEHNVAIVSVDENIPFPSIKVAAAYYGISPKSIGGCLSGKEQIYATGGRLFVYGDATLSDDARQTLLDAAKDRASARWTKGHKHAVVCIETGCEYESCKTAERELGLPSGRVYQSCADGSLVGGKYHFRHADSEAPVPKEWTSEKRARWMAARSRKVMRLSDKRTYLSVKEASADNSIPLPTLWKWCKNRPERGFIFIE